MLRNLALLLLLAASVPAFADVVPERATAEVVTADVATEVDKPAAERPPDLSEPVPLDDPTGVAGALDGLIWPFVKTMLMLCLVLGLVYLTLNKGLGKLMARTQAGKRF